jgi:hypothetical protein
MTLMRLIKKNHLVHTVIQNNHSWFLPLPWSGTCPLRLERDFGFAAMAEVPCSLLENTTGLRLPNPSYTTWRLGLTKCEKQKSDEKRTKAFHV